MNTWKHKESLFYLQLQDRSSGVPEAGMLTINIFLEVCIQRKEQIPSSDLINIEGLSNYCTVKNWYKSSVRGKNISEKSQIRFQPSVLLLN